MTTTRTKTYTITCPECGNDYQARRRVRPGVRHSCGNMACIQAVTAAHNAAVAEYDAMLAARRAERRSQPRQQRTTWINPDLAAIAMINGINPRTGRTR